MTTTATIIITVLLIGIALVLITQYEKIFNKKKKEPESKSLSSDDFIKFKGMNETQVNMRLATLQELFKAYGFTLVSHNTCMGELKYKRGKLVFQVWIGKTPMSFKIDTEHAIGLRGKTTETGIKYMLTSMPRTTPFDFNEYKRIVKDILTNQRGL